MGTYEILEPIGKGGMGEVFRARDEKLDRDVALKVLPDLLASDPDRLARFQREAKLLASLNHPGIASIYGFEESDGVQALVLELVEGPTLAERIAEGPISPDEALAIAYQMADALEAAHAEGRDPPRPETHQCEDQRGRHGQSVGLGLGEGDRGG